MAKWERLAAETRALSKSGGHYRLLYKSTDRVTREIGRRRPDFIYGKRMSTASTGVEILSTAISGSAPFMAGRLGSTEQNVVRFFLKHRQAGSSSGAPYPASLCTDIATLSGVSPTDDETLDRFSSLYINAAKSLDILGVWFHHTERSVVRNEISSSSKLIPLRSMDPLSYPGMWTSALRGKSVCVVHPFRSSIESQYLRRDKVFRDPNILPLFDLKVVQAVQAIGGLPPQYDSWFSALDSMVDAVISTDCEVALLAAGAFGFPLAARLKLAGIKAIHIGGSLQLLFGIAGRRWDEKPYVQNLMTEAWIRPNSDERPPGANDVEGACYW